jgi:hypothetical protein
LVDAIRGKLNPNVNRTALFTIRWYLDGKRS